MLVWPVAISVAEALLFSSDFLNTFFCHPSRIMFEASSDDCEEDEAELATTLRASSAALIAAAYDGS